MKRDLLGLSCFLILVSLTLFILKLLTVPIAWFIILIPISLVIIGWAIFCIIYVFFTFVFMWVVLKMMENKL